MPCSFSLPGGFSLLSVLSMARLNRNFSALPVSSLLAVACSFLVLDVILVEIFWSIYDFFFQAYLGFVLGYFFFLLVFLKRGCSTSDMWCHQQLCRKNPIVCLWPGMNGLWGGTESDPLSLMPDCRFGFLFSYLLHFFC